MNKIKVNDEVIVLTGRDKGKRGTVAKIESYRNKPEHKKKAPRAIVSGINMVKKHQKDNPQANIQGGIIEKEAPIYVSNLAIFNPGTGKADRVGFKTLEDGRKVRFYKSNNEVIDI